MNSEMLITCCPYCDTSFRITEEQLAMAGGTVRCGACLQVFSADEHMLASPAAPGVDVNGDVNDRDPDDGALDEPGEYEALEQDESDEDGDLLSSFDFDGEPLPVVRVPDVRVPDVTVPAMRMGNAYQPGGEDELTDPEAGVSASDDEDTADTESADNETTGSHQFFDQNASERPEGVDDESEAGAMLSPAILVDEYDDGLADAAYAGELDLEAEPAESIVGDGIMPGRVDWRFVAGSLVLVMLLLLQIAWVKRLELSTNNILAPAYDRICELLQCGLPEYADFSQLKATDLVVRPHPSVDKALRIDALIVNQADARQPFPNVEIRFANMNNRLLAARVFAPKEYLRGELTGLKYIPAQTEVRISLEIADPGPDATNYRLDLREAGADITGW